MICDVQTMEDIVLEMKYDAKKAPLGKEHLCFGSKFLTFHYLFYDVVDPLPVQSIVFNCLVGLASCLDS